MPNLISDVEIDAMLKRNIVGPWIVAKKKGDLDCRAGKLVSGDKRSIVINPHNFLTGEIDDHTLKLDSLNYEFMNFKTQEAMDYYLINSEYGYEFRK
jgi:hypothetical protein